jgi:hypothetical protein
MINAENYHLLWKMKIKHWFILHHINSSCREQSLDYETVPFSMSKQILKAEFNGIVQKSSAVSRNINNLGQEHPQLVMLTCHATFYS